MNQSDWPYGMNIFKKCYNFDNIFIFLSKRRERERERERENVFLETNGLKIHTMGWRKNKGPADSAGQWPSWAWMDEKKLSALFRVVITAFSVISSVSFTWTGGGIGPHGFSFLSCEFPYQRVRDMSKWKKWDNNSHIEYIWVKHKALVYDMFLIFPIYGSHFRWSLTSSELTWW